MKPRQFAIAGLVLGLVFTACPLAVADPTYIAPDDRPSIVEISDTNAARLFLIEALLERAANGILSAQHALDRDSERRILLSVLERLEGGETADDAILPLLAEVDVARDAEWLSAIQMDEIRAVQNEVKALLDAAVSALDRVLSEDDVNPRSPDLQVALLLLASLNGWSDPTTAPRTVTVSELLDLYPWHDAWVLEGESIQHAIDKIIDGGTIYIEPASFSEPLVIDKNLTLSWAQVLPNGASYYGEFQNSPGISSAPYRTAITIAGEDIEVKLQNISVGSSNIGILIGDSAHVSILDCCSEIFGCNVGIRLVESASLVFDGGLRFCDVGILVQDQGRLELRDASLGDNRVTLVVEDAAFAELQKASIWRNTVAGVEIHDDGRADVQGSSIVLNQGDGIRLYDRAALHISGSRIDRNGGYGIRAMPSDEDEGCSLLDISTLTISGAGNAIPGRGALVENHLGAFCPAGLEDLLDVAAESSN